MRIRMTLGMALTVALATHAVAAESPAEAPTVRPQTQAASLDLAKPFRTRSPWRFVVTEGPLVKGLADEDEPGALTLCLFNGPAGRCVSEPVAVPVRTVSPDNRLAWEPHFLLTAKAVYPGGPKAPPLLLIVTGSLHSGDGGQLVTTQLVRYDPARDAFRRVFAKATGHNNNEDIRFVTDGPLWGSVITAELRARLPYSYWVVANTPSSAGAYRLSAPLWQRHPLQPRQPPCGDRLRDA